MNNAFTLTRLETRKNALGTTRLVITQDRGALQPGEVLLKIGRFSLTTNSITYAAFGDAVMKYWQFFPTGDADWGHMPAWGFADVAASNVEGVAVGERFYGYFPIASHLRMQPVRVTQRGFYDGGAHRSELVSAYNQYMRCSHDAGYASGAGGLPDAGAPAVHHLIHAGRLSGRQGLLRREAGGGVQCLEQDRLRHGLLSRRARRAAADRGHVRRQSRFRGRAWLLRPHLEL